MRAGDERDNTPDLQLGRQSVANGPSEPTRRRATESASAMSKRPKQRGHSCWCCGHIRPNEKFSGRGHAKHLCRDCAKLDALELAYRQAARDIDRHVDWNGLVRRKQRKSFERFLTHPDGRVRDHAAKVAAHDAEVRAGLRRERLAAEATELSSVRSAALDD